MNIFRKIKKKSHKIFSVIINLLLSYRKYDWVSISDGGGWSIDHDVKEIIQQMRRNGIQCRSSLSTKFVRSRVIHYPNLWAFPCDERKHSKFEHIFLTVFHGDFGLNQEMDEKIKCVIRCHTDITKLIVSNKILKSRFEKWGFPSHKIVVIPVGVDVSKFQSLQPRCQKKTIVIGSFQKDGVGWGSGLEPKLIKGPDVFIEVLKNLQIMGVDFSVRLTGPSRGYVKHQLNNLGVSFEHRYYQDVDSMAHEYEKIDFYLMTSREEGGPKAILECLASGTPFIATRTGVLHELGDDYVDYTSPIDDIDDLTYKMKRLLDDNCLSEKFKKLSEKDIGQFDWKKIARQYQNLIIDANI